jgi:hypothetical protein
MDAINAAGCSAVPDSIMTKSHEASAKLMPTKSAARHEKEYQVFSQWKERHGLRQVEENVMLAYFLDAVSFLIIEISPSG